MLKKIVLGILSFFFLAVMIISYSNWKKDNYTLAFEKFSEANEIVKATEKQEKKDDYKKAVEIYKESMNLSPDINIKKNYEIVIKRIEEENKKEQKNQQNNQQNNQDKQNNQQNNSENKNENQNQKNQENQEKQENKNNQNNSEQNKRDLQEKVGDEEVKAILKRLEGNEKQAFKNNEKILNDSNNKNLENRW